jgi:hypothetical protein
MGLPWGLRETLFTDLGATVVVSGAAALGFGLVIFLTALAGKPSVFTFGQEALTIHGKQTTTGTEVMSIRWDSVELITVERKRKDRRAEFRYSIVAWFRPGREPSSAWLKKHGGKQRRDDGYIVYRTGLHFTGDPAGTGLNFELKHAGGVRFSQLSEALPKYAGHRYVDPGSPADP